MQEIAASIPEAEVTMKGTMESERTEEVQRLPTLTQTMKLEEEPVSQHWWDQGTGAAIVDQSQDQQSGSIQEKEVISVNSHYPQIEAVTGKSGTELGDYRSIDEQPDRGPAFHMGWTDDRVGDELVVDLDSSKQTPTAQSTEVEYTSNKNVKNNRGTSESVPNILERELHQSGAHVIEYSEEDMRARFDDDRKVQFPSAGTPTFQKQMTFPPPSSFIGFRGSSLDGGAAQSGTLHDSGYRPKQILFFTRTLSDYEYLDFDNHPDLSVPDDLPYQGLEGT